MRMRIDSLFRCKCTSARVAIHKYFLIMTACSYAYRPLHLATHLAPISENALSLPHLYRPQVDTHHPLIVE